MSNNIFKPDWGISKVVKCPEFESSKYVLEIGAGDLRRSGYLAHQFPEQVFFVSDITFSPKAEEVMIPLSRKDNVHVHRADAHSFYYRDELFDFAFSIAVMEHIKDTKKFLEEIFRILKPGGVYYFIQSPFWSSLKGHHYRHWQKEVMRTIPPYGHLYLTEEEMKSELVNKKSLNFNIDECLQRIYHREDLSRLSRNQTYEIIESSPLDIKEWLDYEDKDFNEEQAQLVLPKLRYQVNLEEMKISGAYVTLQKPVQ